MLATVLVCFCYLLVNISYIAVLSPEEIAGLSAGGEAIALVRGVLCLVRRGFLGLSYAAINDALQPFGQKVIGKAGVVIFPIMVAVSTFGAAHASLFGASR